MGERNVRERRAAGQPPGRLLAAGTTGFALAITLLMVLSPMSAGASVHPATVLKAPYKGTTNSPGWYAGVTNCGTTKGTAAKWIPTTGAITTTAATTAKTCGKNIGYVGGSSYANWGGQVQVAIPIKVLTTANHSIGATISITLASVQTLAHGLCPSKFIHYPPALYSYESAGCGVSADVSVYVYTQLVDLSNSSWYHHNYTYASVYNDSYWENYSSCYNYGTPTCYNTSGNLSYHGGYGYNSPGAATCTLSGTCTFTQWTNSTAPMPRTDRWAVVVYFSASAYSSAFYQNVAGPFVGSASASMNMATLGNGAKIASITIV